MREILGGQAIKNEYWQTFRLLLEESNPTLDKQQQEDKHIFLWARIFRLGSLAGRTVSLEQARGN